MVCTQTCLSICHRMSAQKCFEIHIASLPLESYFSEMGEENPFALGCFFELTVLAPAQVYLNDLKCSPTIQLDCFELSPPRKVPLKHKLRKRHSMNKRNAQSNKVVAAHCEKIVWEVQETGKLARTLQHVVAKWGCEIWVCSELWGAQGIAAALQSRRKSSTDIPVVQMLCTTLQWVLVPMIHCIVILSTWWILIMTYSDSHYDIRWL